MKKEVIVIGGGIIGLCTAYFLNKEGHKVTVIDKSDISFGASFVNAGYLTPSHIVPLAAPGMILKGLKYMFNSSSPFYVKPRFDRDFLKWAWYFKKSATKAKVQKAMPIIKDINLLSRELFETMAASNELGDFHLERKGLLMVYQTEKEGAYEQRVAERAKAMGLPVNHLNSSEFKDIEPYVDINAMGAFHYLCDRHTTPPQFMNRLLEYLSKQGIAIRKSEEVIDLEVSDKKVNKVITNTGVYMADDIVFAAGSWSSVLSQKLGIKLPLQAGKGYRIDVQNPTGITMPAILMEPKIAVTPMQGFTRFTSTMEFSGINQTIRKERVQAIAKGAARYYEGLQIPKTAIDGAKSGLRPVSPDGLPYIGRSTKYKNLIFATGHAMMGWSLGPATAKLVTELVSNRKTTMDIMAFHPERKF
ncbi:NAD(P)/FAD-dependent oxidoreductase [Allomuricauda sp. SCSIO 65647]|uniref:NAD(P)/FAD-dependent oxidoreductase n=1 Tax=Allomuricauda sp. SCSIO 65647 TaxID=2908843 RepID=UPI001F15BF8C|nr:FAD-dependent oxidoreductase [Muricauda sp. SCSIO 65647]UJH67117.1 FAD-dependent oxidoreductase [Muricauda sp. SCSIO 65647]